VEGPRDRGILRAWSYRLLPAAARRLFRGAVILGGRQPARALDHFRREVENGDAARALCVLDRDDGAHPHGVLEEPLLEEPRVDFFTWSRRHIESYLLVPAAIQRVLGNGDGRVERVRREQLPVDAGEQAYREVDAKRLLGPKGELARALGRPLPLSRIAQATRESELHADVHALFARLRDGVENTDPSA
jgi:hypothetical protein